jgi:glucokinase
MQAEDFGEEAGSRRPGRRPAAAAGQASGVAPQWQPSGSGAVPAARVWETLSADLGRSSSVHTVRLRNMQLMLRELRRNATITRADLGRSTGLAKSTIKEITDELIASGFVEEVRDPDLGGRIGRPATSLRLSPSAGRVVGIDIGAEKILATVATLNGRVIASARQESRNLTGKSAILRAVRSTFRKALAASEVEASSVLATVVGTPGVIHPQTGRISLAPQIRDWDGIDLHKELELPVTGPVIVKRQADLSALAEVALGVAQDIANLLYVHIGIGIGGALVINGHLYTGNDGAAGEVGYLPLSFGEQPPAGTGYGTFEWAAGGSAFARFGRAAAQGPSGRRLRELAGGDISKVSAAAVFTAAAEGDPQGIAIAEELTFRIACGIASAVCVVNPKLAVISGGLSLAGETLLTMIRAKLARLVPVMPDLALSSFGEESVVVGAIQHGVDIALDRIFAGG